MEAAPPPNTGGEPLTFETEENILVTKSKLAEVFSVDAEVDRIYRHTEALQNQGEFIMFPLDGSKNNLQKHALYLGDPDVLNLQKGMEITLRFTPGNNTTPETLKEIFQKGKWHYNWDPQQIESDNGDTRPSSTPFKKSTVAVNSSPSQVVINLTTETEIKKSKFRGTESFWIGWTVDELDAKIKARLVGVSVENVTIEIPSPVPPLDPDDLSYNGIALKSSDFTGPPIPGISLGGLEIPGPTIPGISLGGLEIPGPTIPGQKIKIYYPFGKTPRPYDCFYIANKNAFSKKGDHIIIDFALNRPENKLIYNSQGPLLSWEYWNGKDWSALPDLIEGSYTNKMSIYTPIEHEKVEFNCPNDISPIQVAGKENYWIRVRIVSGDYGKEKIVQTGDTFYMKADDIKAPELRNIKISIRSSPKTPKQCLTYNNLVYENCVKAQDKIQPFEFVKAPDEAYPAIYLGFDQKIEKGPISLLFSIREQDLPENFNPHLYFYYYSSADIWARLDAVDNTEGLTQRATIKLFFPPDFDKHLRLGRDLYWIKAVDMRKKLASSQMQQQKVNGIPTRGIYLNTISAVNSTRVNEELLAGEPLAPSTTASAATAVNKKRVILSKHPMIQDGFDEKVWIDETKFLTDDELDILRAKGHIKEIRAQTGSVTTVLVLWQKVHDIDESGPADRHFTIDYFQGMLEFGDGEHGKALPPGRNKVIVEYATGGGNQGNAKAKEIKTLKSLVPFIDSVSNPESAEGGFQGETTLQALTRGSQGVRHRWQAVTPEDFEWLIREKFPTLARIKCMPTTWIEGDSARTAPGRVSIAVVPNSAEEKPVPSIRLLKDIDQYLAGLSSNVIVYFKHIKVIPPAYTRVSITADIYPISISLAPVAERKALETLALFLHPLRGGPKADGWEFGKIACISDIYALLERVEEIDHVENLSLRIDIEDAQGTVTRNFVISENDPAFTIPSEYIPHALMYNGVHSLAFKFQEPR